MNTRIWIAGMMMMMTLAEATNIAPPASTTSRRSPSSPPSSPPSKSWFREKYLIGTYDTYHDYTLHRFELDDNDHDMCPDVYKSATIFAITGKHINKIKQTCSFVYVQKSTDNHRHPNTQDYTPSVAHVLRFIYITATDVLQFLGQFVCYTFEFGMILMSIILASCSTLFMIILLFCQY